jgi:Calcineurin-like phosphoesterase/Iron/zinc purple acid phosphatase-like protein C
MMRKMKVRNFKFIIERNIIMITMASSLLFIFGILVNIPQSYSVTPDFNFAAVGDWGCNSNTDATAKGIASESNKNKLGSPELVLGLGDYSYQPTAGCWLTKVGNIDDNMKIAVGNHESTTKLGFNQYMQKFPFPSNAYYSFDYQNVHFIVMNTETSYSPNSSQYKFVKSDLAKAINGKNTDWIIVLLHKPLYTSPTSCKIASCQGIASLRDVYHPIFDKNNVDLILEGHLHDYQRSFPLKYNSKSVTIPIVTTTSTSKYNNPDGGIYVIVGTGGINFHKLNSQQPFNAKQQSSSFGHLNIDITNSGQVLTAKFIQNNGKIFDSFTITK